MQQFPRYYLSKYFDELRSQVDTKYALNSDEIDKYLEIINRIELFERDAYNNWPSRGINEYDKKIKSIENKLNNNNLNNLNDIAQLIDEVKSKIEKTIFSNKSILFIDEKSRFYFARNSFLLIINDEHIRMSCIDKKKKLTMAELLLSNEPIQISELFPSYKSLTRNELNNLFLKEKLQNINTNSSDVFNLDILDQKEIIFYYKSISKIHKNSFNRLTKLEKIDFNFNQIEKIHRKLFNGLVNLTVIDFSINKIKKIHPKMFFGLTNLRDIDFSRNEIEQIDPYLFNGLNRLEKIDFSDNKIKEIHPCLNNTNITKKKLQKFLIMKFVTLFIHQPLMIVT